MAPTSRQSRSSGRASRYTLPPSFPRLGPFWWTNKNCCCITRGAGRPSVRPMYARQLVTRLASEDLRAGKWFQASWSWPAIAARIHINAAGWLAIGWPMGIRLLPSQAAAICLVRRAIRRNNERKEAAKMKRGKRRDRPRYCEFSTCSFKFTTFFVSGAVANPSRWRLLCSMETNLLVLMVRRSRSYVRYPFLLIYRKHVALCPSKHVQDLYNSVRIRAH